MSTVMPDAAFAPVHPSPIVAGKVSPNAEADGASTFQAILRGNQVEAALSSSASTKVPATHAAAAAVAPAVLPLPTTVSTPVILPGKAVGDPAVVAKVEGRLILLPTAGEAEKLDAPDEDTAVVENPETPAGLAAAIVLPAIVTTESVENEELESASLISLLKTAQDQARGGKLVEPPVEAALGREAPAAVSAQIVEVGLMASTAEGLASANEKSAVDLGRLVTSVPKAQELASAPPATTTRSTEQAFSSAPPRGDAPPATHGPDVMPAEAQQNTAKPDSSPAALPTTSAVPAPQPNAPAVASLIGSAEPKAAAVPISGVPFEIASRASDGKRRFEIRLDPPELGRIDVRLDLARDGSVNSRLIVERAETLDLLRRDAGNLERALQSAGLQTGGSGMEFSLRDGSGQERKSPDNLTRADLLIVPDDDVAVTEAVRRAYGVLRGLGRGVDMRI